MGWYFGLIGNLHHDEFLICIFTGKVENDTPIILNKTLYHYWYKDFRNQFSPILINTTQDNAHF